MTIQPSPSGTLLQSVRVRLSLVVGLAMLPVLMFSLASAVREFYEHRNSVQNELIASAEIVSSEAEKILESAHQVLKMARAHEAVRENLKPTCGEFLRSSLAGLPAFANIATIAPNGDVLCSANQPNRPFNVSQDKWFPNAVARHEFTIDGPLIGHFTGDYVLVASLPMNEEPGADNTLVSLSIKTDFLDRYVHLPTVSEQTHLILVKDSGEYLYSEEEGADLPRPDEIQKAVTDKAAIVASTTDSGEKLIFALVQLGETHIIALVGRPAFSINAPILIELATDVAAPVALSAIALLIVWFALERMSLRWVRHLRAVAIAQRRGMSSVRAREMDNAPIEYRELGDALNTMADAIETRQNNLLATLKEREMLLREVHHRVKNNLQIIISLFGLQARSAADDKERFYLREMQARVESLALVYHAAYQSDQIQLIPMDEFLPDLAGHIERVWEQDHAAAPIKIDCSVDDVSISMDEAVPLAQLVIEVVSGLELQCRTQDARLCVSLSLRKDGADALLLTIAAQPPIPPLQDERYRKVGAALIAAFAKQLGGTVIAGPDTGNAVQIRMPIGRPAQEPFRP